MGEHYGRVKFDFRVEKKVYKPHQHGSLLRMARKTYPKSTRRKKICEVGFKKMVKKVG